MDSQPTSSTPLPESLTVTQAAKMLGCSAQSLRLWEKQGKIRPSYRTIGGGHRRYYRKDIEALIAQRHAHDEEVTHHATSVRLLTDPV